MSLFTLINFANVECEAGGLQGLCQLEEECQESGGSNIGSCAQGFGVCCFSKFLIVVFCRD